MLNMLKQVGLLGRNRLASDYSNIAGNSSSLLSQPEGTFLAQCPHLENQGESMFPLPAGAMSECSMEMGQLPDFLANGHELGYDLNQFDWIGSSFDLRSWDTITEMFLSNTLPENSLENGGLP